ncbi:MAG: phosphoserine phosphatase SerB [Canibacter sp.]
MTHISPRPLVVLDCDSTSIEEEVIELLAEVAGTRDEVARITEQAMQGDLDFAASLRSRVQTLAGVPVEVFSNVASQVTLSPGLRELIEAVHHRSGKVGIVSGGFVEVLDLFLPDTGTDVWRANRLEVKDGVLTGRVDGEIVDAHTKASSLREWTRLFGINPAHTVAIGDGANDLQMMEVASLSVGYRPKSIVRETADIVIEDSLAQVIEHLDRL